MPIPQNKKIFAFDIDDTLTESKQKLRYDMGELLLKLMEKSRVAIISGGSFEQFNKQILSSLNEVAKIMNLPTGAQAGSALASGNALPHFANLSLLPAAGSMRYEYDLMSAEWKMTHLSHFPDDLKKKTLDALADVLATRSVSAGEDAANPANVGANPFELPAQSFGDIVEDRQTQITFSALGQKAPVDLKRTWDPDQAKRKKIKAHLDALLPDADISMGGMTSIDILPKGQNKATGLEGMLAAHSLTKADMSFVGDALFEGGNDYSVALAGIDTIMVKNPAETANLIKSWLE